MVRREIKEGKKTKVRSGLGFWGLGLGFGVCQTCGCRAERVATVVVHKPKLYARNPHPEPPRQAVDMRCPVQLRPQRSSA